MDKNTYETPTPFGYELIRDHVLTSVLGAHESDILYWAGKELARKFPSSSIEELSTFFTEAGWGQLALSESSKKEAFYELTNVAEPKVLKQRKFQLEAGFIAEQYQMLTGILTECHAEPKLKREKIQFHVKWDKREEI